MQSNEFHHNVFVHIACVCLRFPLWLILCLLSISCTPSPAFYLFGCFLPDPSFGTHKHTYKYPKPHIHSLYFSLYERNLQYLSESGLFYLMQYLFTCIRIWFWKAATYLTQCYTIIIVILVLCLLMLLYLYKEGIFYS